MYHVCKASLQNFLIDMENGEVILVDTGLSPETPFKGYRKVNDYVAGLEALGYKPEQVTTILVTHKHPDHTGELKSFPNARVRDFIKNNPTVYLSTHTPEGYQNLEGKVIMKLD